VFVPWGVGESSLDFNSLSELMEYIYSLGFREPPYRRVCSDIDEVERFYNLLLQNRDSIDGRDGWGVGHKRLDDIENWGSPPKGITFQKVFPKSYSSGGLLRVSKTRLQTHG